MIPIEEQLQREQLTPFHSAMLDNVRRQVRMSRTAMSKHYSDWDMQDQVYRGLRYPTADDRERDRRDEPTKMIVPNTFAQCQTFVSFLFLLYNQNQRFFELCAQPQGAYGTLKEDSEVIMQRDWVRNKGNVLLFQHLTNVAKFGTGIMECDWTEEYVNAWVTPPPTQAPGLVPATVQGASGYQQFLQYQGNRIRTVSPYRFFPDTRHALVDFQKGDFCAVEEEYSMGQLRTMETQGEVYGVEFIRPLGRDLVRELGALPRTTLFSDDDRAWLKFDTQKSSSVVLVTKCQTKVVPSQFQFGQDTLGPEDFQVMYDVWYANNHRIIKCEPVRNWHNMFKWGVAQFTPDMHHTVTLGLADLVYRLQDVISWFVNSHITSVRRMIANRLVLNTNLLDAKTLDGEGNIYLRKGVNVPLDRAYAQLKVQDVTGNHMNDVDILGKLMEVVTGVNGNAMGQYNSGRRSAQEARVVTAGAAGRMKMHGQLIWDGSLGPLGRMMLTNGRQSLSQDSFARIIGQVQDVAQRYAAYVGTPEQVICSDDYVVFDSTLASEKGFMAQSIQDLLSVVLQTDPMAARALSMKLDPMKMISEIASLRGDGPVDRFAYDPQQQAEFQQMMLQQAAMAQQGPPQPGQPGSNIVPVAGGQGGQ